MKNATTLHITLLAFIIPHSFAVAATFVPGTGVRVSDVGDDFEDIGWSYDFNGAKSSTNIDGNSRSPLGESTNGRWSESAFRGHPDTVERVATPPGGVSGSTGALRLQTVNSGVPDSPSGEVQQEDFLANVDNRLGGKVVVSEQPSVVVRLYVPDFDAWEDRTGPSFALRGSVNGHLPATPDQSVGLFPGIFIDFRSATDPEHDVDFATLRIRGNDAGDDFLPGIDIADDAWLTLGMSYSVDGAIHFYASEGVDDLTSVDHIASHFAGGFQVDSMDFFYFNVVNLDDGATPSTNWVVDDAFLYVNSVPEPSASLLAGLFAIGTCSRRNKKTGTCNS